jgi:hypothetical protein
VDKDPSSRSDDGLDQWLTQLSGLESAAEAQVLRQTIQAEERRLEAQLLGHLAEPEAEQRAVVRLRRHCEELREPHTGLAWWRRPWLANQPLWASALGLGLLVAVGVSVLYALQDDNSTIVTSGTPPVFRSGINVVQIADDEPLKRAKRLSASLEGHVDQKRLYSGAGRVTLDFEVDADRLELAQQAIADRKLALQLRQGKNRIELIER